MTAIIIIAALVVCAVIHRRVISALIRRAPMPKAPNWHFWLSKKYRRG